MSDRHDRSRVDRQTLRGHLVARLRQLAQDVQRLTAGIDDGGLNAHTVPGAWSLAELVIHIHRVQQLFESRIEEMRARDCPAFTSYAPEDDAEFADRVARGPGREAVDAYLADRERFARQLDALTPADWTRTGRHPTFGVFDVEFLVDYMVQHESHHVYQLFMRRVPLVRRA